MRKRSFAVHAQTFEDYTTTAHRQAAGGSSCSPYQQQSPKSMKENNRPSQLQTKTTTEQYTLDSDVWKEFDFCNSAKNSKSNNDEVSQLSTAENSMISCESPLFRNSVEIEKKEIVKLANMMVIGGSDIDVYSFVDEILQDQTPISRRSSTGFDLVVKEQETADYKLKVKIWIQDLAQCKHQEIVNAYYKTVETYVFIFNAEVRESFESIVATIERVRIMSNGKFNGMLVCSGSGYNQLQVSIQELELVKEHYGLRVLEAQTGTSMSGLNQEILGSLSFKTV